jgi:lipopolysaccharide/colanic/teichoic acid biosynthesis glycosyltransferase
MKPEALHDANALAGEAWPSTGAAAPSGRVPAWKRGMDVAIALAALAALSPVMAIAAVLVRLGSPGPVLFRQIRVGRDEKPFAMLKFRTMTLGEPAVDVDLAAIERELQAPPPAERGEQLFRPAHDPRITRAGKWLRRFSIDELPQLFNVLKGDMSVVGPRPALPFEVELFDERQRRRHVCMPGLTGLWQVSGRNRLSTREMLELDLRYVSECSPFLDLCILLKTPRAVLLDRFTR